MNDPDASKKQHQQEPSEDLGRFPVAPDPNTNRLLDTIPDMLFILDDEGRILHVSRAVLDRLGHGLEDLVGQPVASIYPESRRHEGTRIMASVLDGHQDSWVVPVVARSGRQITVEMRIAKDQWNGRAAFLCIGRDISQDRLSEQKFSLAFHTNSTAMAVSTMDEGIYLDVNQAFLDLYRSTREEVVGKSVRELNIYVHPDDREEILREVMEKGRCHGRETEVCDRGGRIHTGILSADPLTIHGTECWLTTFVDITDRKKAEEELQKVHQELESRVRQRTGELSNALERLRAEVDERRQAEDALGKSEAKFRSYVELSPLAVFIADREGQLVQVNRSATELLGYSKEVLLGMHISELHPAEDRQTVFDDFATLAREGRIDTEHRFQKQDGSLIWISLHAAMVEDGLSVAHCWDITSRKETEDLLRRYEFLSGNSRDIILFMGRDKGKIIEANAAAEKAYGYSRDELLNLTIKDLRATDSVSLMAAQMAQADRTGILFETVHKRKDGSVFPVEVSSRGETIGGTRTLVSIIRDITERKQTEEALRQSEETYRTLISASPDAITVTDEAGRISLVSHEALELFGIASEDLVIGRSILEWVTPDDQQVAWAAVRQLLTTGYTRPRELVLKKGNGTPFGAEVRAAPIRYSDGTIRGTILITRDVTERNNLQAQLLQAQKMEAIGNLAGGVAHDFNNILTAIMGYTGLMEMMLPEDHQLRNYVNQIQDCTSKAANLTRSLLAFSRKQAIELKPQSLNIILRDLEKLLRRIVPEDVELTVSLHEDMTIMADMTQIDQVLINLVSNAKDAMPLGGQLHIETKAVDLDRQFEQVHGFGEPGSYALITVSDTGTGMDESTQKRIFEPFFTTKEVGKGTGLGLSIVYGIIKQHGGYILVSSEPGKGSIFSVYLPVAKAGVSEARPVLAAAQGGTETLLLAEDNPDVRRIAGEILRTWGYTVVEARDGEEAVRKYVEHSDRIDLLVLDVVMPGKNGKEVYEEVRKVNPSIRVLFMSGYTGDVVLDKGIQDTTVDYVSKPLSANELLRKVRDVLNG